jgi:hypothetical protein
MSELIEEKDDWFGDLSGGQRSKVSNVLVLILQSLRLAFAQRTSALFYPGRAGPQGISARQMSKRSPCRRDNGTA